MWYVSGNHDETLTENPERFIIDRSPLRKAAAGGAAAQDRVGGDF
jgi:cytochrome P450